MELVTLVQLLAGLVLLVLGADWLVKGGERIGLRAGLSPLVVGLTIVAFGTSSPELGVSISAVYSGHGDMALANVVGSNTFNVLLILGGSAVIAPLVVSKQVLRQDVPVMIAVSLLVAILATGGLIGRVEGVVLFGLLIAYTGWLVIQGRRDAKLSALSETSDASHPGPDLRWAVGLVVAGLALLILGSRWLLASAIDIATAMGVDERVVGLTIVAAGTSLPEVATSLIATWRGKLDIAIGNVVGSNTFNLLGILGISAAVSEGLPVTPAAMNFDVPVMVAVAALCLPLALTGGRIARWEGVLMLGLYAAHTAYVVLVAMEYPSVGTYRSAMLYAVLPAVIALLTASLLANWQNRNGTRLTDS